MRYKSCAILLIMVFLSVYPSALGYGLSLSLPDTLRPFDTMEAVVLIPVSGRLSVLVSSAFGDELPIAEDMEVKMGAVTLPYRGLSYGGMPLKQGTYTVTARLELSWGRTFTAEKIIEVMDKAATLEYALPKSLVYYQKQSDSWFMDCSVTGGCTVNFEVYKDEAMTVRAASVRKKIGNAGIFKISWKGTTDGRKKLKPGLYFGKVYASGREEAFTFPLEIKSGKPPAIELAPTGELLPAAMDDAAVWKAMMAPMVVVNIKATDHQNIYTEASIKSEVLGTIHGQSQGLEVLEIKKSFARVRAWRHEDGACIEGYVPLKRLKTVTPSPHYGVLIDKSAQVLTVYEHGKPLGHMQVSTGLKAPEKLFRETRAGAFMTTDRLAFFESGGYRYDYPIRIDGGNLLHQLGYKTAEGAADFADHLAELGQKASEGCVRMDHRTSEDAPINAYWMWTHLEYGTKVLVLEGAEEAEEAGG